MIGFFFEIFMKINKEVVPLHTSEMKIVSHCMAEDITRQRHTVLISRQTGMGASLRTQSLTNIGLILQWHRWTKATMRDHETGLW